MSIYINYGNDPAGMAEELMRRADVASLLRPGLRVTIKPNLVVARPASGGATTHPEIVEGAVRYLRACGVDDITIAEGSWVGADTARAFEACGYAALAKKYGVTLVDTKHDKAVSVKNPYLEGMKICESAVSADFIINVPVLKGHCQTGMTCCLKNMKGLIPDSEKRRYHSAGLDRPIAALATVVKPQLHIVDSICGDLDFEEGGNPVVSNRILLGFDAVLLDSYCAPLIGYRPDDIGHLRLAKEFGAGSYAGPSTQVIEMNADKKPTAGRTRSGANKEHSAGAGARRYAGMIDEDGACSACYAALVYALSHTGGAAAKRLSQSGGAGKIKVGQGFAGKTLKGLGSGNCTSGCEAYVKGCPPSALDIMEFLNGVRH
ncbi:MAG: DUF362 domain-containing protein [Oscillospiraceae bacterium]|nr:DUF362 domain-containing protein [Oscillospiraceae bacterium]